MTGPTGAVDWARFFSGEYDVRQVVGGTMATVGRVRLDFAVNGASCLAVSFSSVHGYRMPVHEGFFHLTHHSGNHSSVAGRSHPNNWYGNGDPYLDGAVMEGSAGGNRYYRFGCWEEDGFAQPGQALRTVFRGKTYEPSRTPLEEWELVSVRSRPRPADNYPWNLQAAAGGG